MRSTATHPVREIAALRLEFDRTTGGLTAITNRLTGHLHWYTRIGDDLYEQDEHRFDS